MFILLLLSGLQITPAASEDQFPEKTIPLAQVPGIERKGLDHPWIERAVAAGFQEQFGLSDLPIRAWARQGIEFEAMADHAGRAIKVSRLIVMIESDGASWQAAGYRAPSNPTPKSPISLQMALELSSADRVLYLARPCQFIAPWSPASRACEDPRWWTSWRFSTQVVKAYQEAILGYAADQGNQTLVLAGFSGGGSLAALIATEFKQLALMAKLCLITIASPLDLNAWTHHHRLSFFRDVPDEGLLKRSLIDLPAAYAFGDADRKVPLESAGVFLNEAAWIGKVYRYKDLKHNAEWVKLWPELLTKAC